MSLFDRRPWYAGGLAFECARCGGCCAGPAEGYVWVEPQGIEAIAAFLKIDAIEVRRRYVRDVDGRLSLVEQPQTKDCIFLSFDGDNLSRCAIYPVRPAQCRSWPFWPGNLYDPQQWGRAGQKCRGINRGPVHSLDEIQQKRNRTS